MSGYRVDPDVLAAADGSLADAARRANVELRSLQTSAQPLLDGWHGSGGVHFRQCWLEWHRGAVDLLAALEDLAGAIGVSGRGYARTEDTVRTSMVSS